MPKRVAPDVSLTAELAAFVAERVASGRYGSASQVVRMGLQLLEQQEPRSLAPQRGAEKAELGGHGR